jgi:hypothetical protein
MDKFNNSNSSLALQKFYNQENHDVRILELQQRLKTEKLTGYSGYDFSRSVCQIEMTKFINEEKDDKPVVEEQVINEEKVIIENQVVEEILDTEIIKFDTVYQSNENFEIEKPTSISVENSKPVLNQVKINNLIKLKKW